MASFHKLFGIFMNFTSLNKF